MGSKGKKKVSSKNRRGTKKGDKIHGIKKGKKGEAAAYITRAQTLAKLQIPLADFRKLCILKGIYPRDPKKKNQGNDKTYYHKKDITFLSHEPLLAKFYDLKTFMKRFKKFIGRKEFDLAKSTESRKPTYTVHHLVRERYATVEDAILDLDDALSMLALFQSLSADQKREIPIESINEATKLYEEFQLYVIRAQALRKVFASIKGYYFQAEIMGQTVTWLAPHQFSQEMPGEVDFRVMLTFLEFYRTMLKFINYRLYAELGLAYPPKRVAGLDRASAEIASLELEMREAGLARAALAEEEKKADDEVTAGVAADFGTENEEAQEMQRQLAEQTRMKSTFRGLRVFVNREIPLRPAYFVLLCGGVAEVGWERGALTKESCGKGSAFGVVDEGITHQIIDRPAEQVEKREGRELVQPQWIFDSFNVGCQLPVAIYAPGRAPPPHLSPFVDDQAEGYVPRQRELLDKLANEAGIGGVAATSEVSAVTALKPVESAESHYDTFTAELKAETKGIWHADFAEQQKKDAEKRAQQIIEEAQNPSPESAPPKAEDDDAEMTPAEPGPKPTEQEEELLRQKALMSKKHKRLLRRIDYTKEQKKSANEHLVKKRKALEKKNS